MRISYDPDADVMYLYLNDGRDPEVDHSVELGMESEGLTADFDHAGHVVGLEVQFASRRFGAAGPDQALVEILSGRFPTSDRPAA
ncbi:MAG TPA: DUF2283 domain-containing protein [Chloroflexota bacterium]|nr:DUF2283 domain-containing protein [Chloroflexota bacterium]